MDKISGAYSRTNSYEQVTAPSSISDEFYYRFMPPDANNLYGLAPGETYTLSGSVSHTAGELKFRSQYSTNGSSWVDLSAPSDLGIPVSDGSAFTSFSHTFTVPVGATGIYISLQNYDYTAGSLFRFKNMKLEKGSVATNWCLSQSELTTTTGSYRGVTLNDRGLTATAGSTTVAMNSNAGFLINNLKDASADNPGGQVFHVDTDGNLTISGSLTSSATISGVNFTGQNLTLSGSLKLTGDNSAISSNNGDVVFNKNGIIATSGPTTVTINGTDPLRIQSNNNDIFKVDNKGSLTISGNLTTGDSPNSTISGVNFTGESLTLSGSMKVKGQILFANNSGVLSSQGLSLKGGGLSISDSQGNQTTYIKPDGTFTTNKGYFEGDITAHKLILDSSTSSINMGGDVFQVNSKGDVTANSFTSKNVNITGGTLDAGGVNITNMNADNITTGTLSGQHLEINGDTKISGILDVADVSLKGNSGMIGLDGSNGIVISSADTLFQTKVTRYGMDFLTTTNGTKEALGGITTGASITNGSANGISIVLDTLQKLGNPYGGDFFSIGTTTSIDNNDNRNWTRAMDYDASGQLHQGGFMWYEKSYLTGGGQNIYVGGVRGVGNSAYDPLLIGTTKFPKSAQPDNYVPVITLGYVGGSISDAGVGFLWNQMKPYGDWDITDVGDIWYDGVKFRFTWVSHPQMMGGSKEPGFVRMADDNSVDSGIAFAPGSMWTLGSWPSNVTAAIH